MRIGVLCPTRDGPDRLRQAFQSMIDTSKSTTMIACIDDDQRGLYAPIQHERLVYHVAPRVNVVDLLNSAVKLHPFDVYGLMVDDARFKTFGWDDYVVRTIEAFPAGIGVVSAHHGKGWFVNFPYVSARWIEVVGWYACPQTHHFCWDTVLELLGEATHIDYASEQNFAIEHDLLQNDATLCKFASDCIQFLGWCVNGRRDVVQKLREAM